MFIECTFCHVDIQYCCCTLLKKYQSANTCGTMDFDPSNPWSDIPFSRIQLRSTGGKRRRRGFAATSATTATPSSSVNGRSDDSVSGKNQKEKDFTPITSDVPRRRMQPAVFGMSVKEERKALHEIRNLEDPQTTDILQCNGMSIGTFALRYICGHHSSRRNKSSATKSQMSANDFDEIDPEVLKHLGSSSERVTM